MSYRRLLHVFCFIWVLPFTNVAQSIPNPDRHNTTLSESWLSCQTNANPNVTRGNGHWIQYDLGDTYALQSSNIWNFNTPERINSYNNENWSLTPLSGKLDDGMKDVIIDLSIDGTTWTEWGRFTIPKASGSGIYAGSAGPDFGGKVARYVLITGLSNYGGTCYGLSEVRIKGNIVTISSTDDPLADASITAFPNPFNDASIVELKNFNQGQVQLSLVDINGKEVLNTSVNISGTIELYNIKGANLASGIYILNVRQNGAKKSITLEVIK